MPEDYGLNAQSSENLKRNQEIYLNFQVSTMSQLNLKFSGKSSCLRERAKCCTAS
jgi:hypothetical protein